MVKDEIAFVQYCDNSGKLNQISWEVGGGAPKDEVHVAQNLSLYNIPEGQDHRR